MNNYQTNFTEIRGGSILNQTDMFAEVDKTVVLPDYTRADAGVFFYINERVGPTVENLFNKKYYLNADNNKIPPGPALPSCWIDSEILSRIGCCSFDSFVANSIVVLPVNVARAITTHCFGLWAVDGPNGH